MYSDVLAFTATVVHALIVLAVHVQPYNILPHMFDSKAVKDTGLYAVLPAA